MPVLRVMSEYFYEEPLKVAAEDLRALDQVFHAGASTRFRGEKFCGGFHADYLLDWLAEEERVVRVLVCFGCREITYVIGEKAQRTDMTPLAFKQLQPLLAKYRQRRPIVGAAGWKSRLKPDVHPLPPPVFDVAVEAQSEE